MYGVYFKNSTCMIVSSKVLISKKPDENVQSEDKQCKTFSPGSEPPDSNSTHQDELAGIAPSVPNELDLSPNVAAYENDFNFDEWERSSDVVTVTDSQPSFATKSDIKRLEAKQELLLENQNQIMENLTAISNLLKERAKKRGILRVPEPTSSDKSVKILNALFFFVKKKINKKTVVSLAIFVFVAITGVVWNL